MRSLVACSAVEVPQPEHYRELFRLIGAPWLWFSRLILDDAHLAAIIQHPKVELYSVLDDSGREVGMLELDFREPHECELAFIGLSPSCPARAMAAGCSPKPFAAPGARASKRVHVHTCSLDHPAALVRLSPRRLHALQARDRALPRPAPARHPADGLRASDPAARHARLSVAAAGKLDVDPRQHHR